MKATTQNTVINLNVQKKVVNIAVSGRVSPDESKEFVAKYQQIVASINPSQYTLELDTTQMDLVRPEMIDELEGVFKLYQSTGFNKVIFIITEQVIYKMQFQRVAKKAGLQNFEFIKD